MQPREATEPDFSTSRNSGDSFPAAKDVIDTDCTHLSNIAGSIESAGAELTVSALDGAAIYATECASCHGVLANSEYKMATALEIADAILKVGVMKNIELSPEELEALEGALDIP